MIVNSILMISTIVIAVYAVRQAGAAELTAKVALNSQRGWILVESIKAPNQIDYFENICRASPQLEFKFKVFGIIPIKITNSRIRFHFVQRKSDSANEPDLPIQPNYGENHGFSQNSGIGRIHYPESEFSIKSDLGNTSISSEEWHKFVNRENILCAYGVINYQDAYQGAATRETRFCYVYQKPPSFYVNSPMPDGKSTSLDGDGFRVGGPDAYNQAT